MSLKKIRTLFICFPFCSLINSCTDERENTRLVIPYEWTDSVFTYTIKQNEIILSSNTKLKEKEWNLRLILQDTTSTWYSESDALILPVINNEIHIPLNVPDSLNRKNLRPAVVGFPNIGIMLLKSDNQYYMGQPVFYIDRNHSLHVFRQENIKGRYYISKSLLEGKDSEFYKKKALSFYKDSM